VLISLITPLPFTPGTYDPLAAPLSMMARGFGFVGLLLVPVGVLWTGLPVFRHAPTISAQEEATLANVPGRHWAKVLGTTSI
jgi:hypothetical protein